MAGKILEGSGGGYASRIESGTSPATILWSFALASTKRVVTLLRKQRCENLPRNASLFVKIILPA
jgi:hypothetical protein